MPTRQHEPHRPRLEETTVDFFSNWMKLSLREQMLRIKVSVRLNQELRRWGRWANIELNTGINAATKLERERDVLKLSVEESNKAAEASIVQATELVEKLKASTNLTAGEVKPVVDGVVELQEGHRLNQSARELREHFARREQEILAREMAVDAIAQEAALEAAYQAYHLAMIATATSGNITAYECGPVVLKEADGSSSANLDHPFWKGRALGSWLMNNAKLGSGDWYGADDLTGQHPLSLRHPHGRNQPWGYFTGISHALRGMEEPDLSDIPDPKTPWNYQ
jgi:putative component of toxin-antitoxin plasmid stabilization module